MTEYISFEDKRIREIIEAHKGMDDYYDEVIADNPSFAVHDSLSSLRHGLLSWYDFKKTNSVLEIGAANGALTGVLCKNCGKVVAVESNAFCAESLKIRFAKFDNLIILQDDWKTVEFKELFDYVIIFDATQCDADFLNRVVGLLKPTGRLLISYQNCLGMKYLCGMPERHTGRLFEGISDFSQKEKRKSFSRGEICEAVEASGFKGYKFYYPLPDDRYPQLIYTDKRLPEENVSERLLTCSQASKPLLGSEEKLYKDIIRQNAFPMLANSFFVECSMDGKVSDVTYAALSSDRGKQRGFATTIHESGMVYKKPLHDEGAMNAKHLYENIVNLEKNGVPVVPHTYENGIVKLPYIEFPTLADYIRKEVSNNPKNFIKVLKGLYSFIEQSSDTVDTSYNAMLPRMRTCYEGRTEQLQRLETINWGPILNKAYIELISLNCFYNEQEEKYLFFDQEFVRENYPAKYILFRTIAISYVFIPNMEQYIPLQEIKDVFDLNDTWEFFEKEEALLMDEIRFRNRYKCLYKWGNSGRADEKILRSMEYFHAKKQNKKLILFGTGKKFDEYFSSVIVNDLPVFAVDNDSAKWGKEKNGLAICSPQTLLDMPKEERMVLICCANTKEIEKQLEEMGIYEYWRYSDIFV